jgi:Ubiquitin interaction motif
MVEKDIYPMDQTIDCIVKGTLDLTDGSKTQVDEYISNNLNIISNAEINAEIKYSNSNYDDVPELETAYLTQEQIDKRELEDLEKAIQLSLMENKKEIFEGESYAESSTKNINKTSQNIDEDDEELQLAIALSLSKDSDQDINNSSNSDMKSNETLENKKSKEKEKSK